MPVALNHTMTRREWTMLLVLALLWGGTFFFIGLSLPEVPPITLVALRVSLSAIVFYLIMLALRKPMPRDVSAWSAFLVIGTLNNAIPFALIVWAQTRIPSGLASILNATTPLFTVIAAHYFTLDEKLTPARFAGVLLGATGVAVMIGAELMGGLTASATADIAILCAAMSYALAGIYGRRFRRMGVSPMATAAGQVTVASALLVPSALAIEHPWTLALPSATVCAAILGLVMLSTVVGFILYFRILETAGATNLLLVTFLIPISAILLGALFLDEHLQPKHFVGIALIGCGLAAIDGRPVSWIVGSSGLGKLKKREA